MANKTISIEKRRKGEKEIKKISLHIIMEKKIPGKCKKGNKNKKKRILKERPPSPFSCLVNIEQ